MTTFRDYTRLTPLYNRFVDTMLYDIQSAQICGPDPENADLAMRMVRMGKQVSFARMQESLALPFEMKIARDFDNPPEYTNPSVIGKPWADPVRKPSWKWNKDRRQCNAGISYATDENNLARNPFGNYGVNGRGSLGRYGPNHAVDIAPCRVMRNKNGEMTLHVLGILRQDSGMPALCGGFVEFEKNGQGHYPYHKLAQFKSQTYEMFEEMISGSVPLMPEYATGLQEQFARAGQNLTARRQIITQRKLLQVQQEDPEFLENLHYRVMNAHECYHGPVLSSSRNTNHSWMETRLSWFLMDEKEWEDMRSGGKFAYDFVAGDDAAAVLWHEITPDLIDRCGSHAAFFCHILGSFLVSPEGQKFPEIKDQARQLLDYPAKPDFSPETLQRRGLTP